MDTGSSENFTTYRFAQVPAMVHSDSVDDFFKPPILV